jgi:hypothetical protein
MSAVLSNAQAIVLRNIIDRRWVDIRKISEPYRQNAIDLAMMEPPLIDINADQMFATDAGRSAIENRCERCGEQMVCRCGQTESAQGWPCTHGGCLFECPRCEGLPSSSDNTGTV